MKPRLDLVYVSIQFILFGLMALDWQGIDVFVQSPMLRYAGVILILLGGLMVLLSMLHLSESLSPFPTPKPEGEHKQVGFYKYVRHPIYTGIILGAFGVALFSASEWRFLIAIALYLLFQFKARYEETLLLAQYSTYQKYLETTGRFFPKLIK